MFNHEDSRTTKTPKKKVIQVKSHDFFETNHSTVDSVPSQEEKLKSLQTKVDTATKQYEMIKRQQEELVQLTKKEIEQEKENWIREKEVWMEQAKKQGFELGFTDGKAEALQKYEESIQQINSIVDRANEDYHALVAKNDETIVDLAIRVAGKILKQKITEDPTHFLRIVKAAIKELQDQSVITIYLHPENYPFVMDHKQELSKLLEDNMKLSIYVKEMPYKNACVIEHPFGQIDASVDTQLSQIRQILQDVVQESSNG